MQTITKRLTPLRPFPDHVPDGIRRDGYIEELVSQNGPFVSDFTANLRSSLNTLSSDFALAKEEVASNLSAAESLATSAEASAGRASADRVESSNMLAHCTSMTEESCTAKDMALQAADDSSAASASCRASTVIAEGAYQAILSALSEHNSDQNAHPDLDLSSYMQRSGGCFLGGILQSVQVPSSGVIDVSAGNGYVLAPSDDVRISFTGVTENQATRLLLTISNGGQHAITWPANVSWERIPHLAAYGVSTLEFVTADGGTTWFGSLLGSATSSM